MAKIISIGTALPEYCHQQNEILKFMQKAYKLDETEARKLAFLYRHSEIEKRYSVLSDFSRPEGQWEALAAFANAGSLDARMQLFQSKASDLSVRAIEQAIDGVIQPGDITHLITVSCTGLSAPGLDLQVVEAMDLRNNIFRTSVNFMGCYAAIHALKLGKLICDSSPDANVVIVCTELCTIHFQERYSLDNAASSLLFGDGSAAVLLSNNLHSENELTLDSFYSEVCFRGKDDMSWQVSNEGFLMKLSSYVPQLIQEDISRFVGKALKAAGIQQGDIAHWCIHPGGKKILEVIQSQLHLTAEDLSCSKKVLAEYGNMSSPTILFVLKEIMKNTGSRPANVFGVAFGPGLTMETFTASRT